MTNVTFNRNNITITGTGTLDFTDICRIDFDCTHVIVSGFKTVSFDASLKLNKAIDITFEETCNLAHLVRFTQAKVNHHGTFFNKKYFKDLNDLKTSLELEKCCNDNFVYLIYPAEHHNWDGEVFKGYHLNTCNLIKKVDEDGEKWFVTENEQDFFIEIDSYREVQNHKQTKVTQTLKAIYPLNLKETVGNDFVTFLFNNAIDKVVHTDDYNKKWLTNEIIVAPTLAEIKELETRHNNWLQEFENNLILNMEETLHEHVYEIFHDRELQDICRRHTNGFRTKVYEQDSFGPVVAGFVANGKDYFC